MTTVTSVVPVDGGGEHIWFLGAGLVTIKVPGEAVDNRCTVVEFLMPHGLSPPKHTHPQDEAFVMLDGEVTFVADERRFVARTGDSWVVPRGIPHTFLVDSESCRMVAVYTPAGPEHCFRNGGVPAAAPTLPPPDAPTRPMEEIEAAMTAYDHKNVGPPLGPDD